MQKKKQKKHFFSWYGLQRVKVARVMSLTLRMLSWMPRLQRKYRGDS